jgi:hypothetical protein
MMNRAELDALVEEATIDRHDDEEHLPYRRRGR